MESFSIVCTTCGRRLRVKDTRLVGQIVACPKCKGMVLIAAPEEFLAPKSLEEPASKRLPFAGIGSSESEPQHGLELGDGDVDSEALTAPGITINTDALADEIGVLPRFMELDESDFPILPADDAAHPVNLDQPFGEPLDGDVPPVAYQSEKSARNRQIATIVIIGLLAFTACGAAFLMVVRSWKKSRDSQLAQQTDRLDPVPISVPEDVSNNQTATDVTNSDESQAAEDDRVQADQPASIDPEEETELTDDADHPMAIDPQPPADKQAVPLFPESSDLFPEGSGVDNGGPEKLASELPDSMKKFLNVVEFGQTASNLPENPLEPAPAMEELRIQFPDLAISDSDYPLPADPVDVAKRSEMRLLGFSAKAKPLDELMRVIGQLTGIPIEFDLIAFDIAGVDLDKPVSILFKEIKAGVLIDETLKKAECRWDLGNDGIVRISPVEATVDEAIAKAFELEDFGGQFPISRDELRQLASVSDELQIDFVNGRLVADGDRAIKFRLVLVLETLRQARSLPPKLQNERMLRWIRRLDAEPVAGTDIDDGLTADWPPLPAHPVGIDALQAYAIDLVLGDLARDADSALAMDWTSCWAHGLSPSESSLPWFRDRNAPGVVREVLQPFGLEAFSPGQGVWWIGTREYYEEMLLMGIVQSKLPVEQAGERIAAAVGMELTTMPAVYDSASERWIVFMPRYVLRKLPSLL